MSHKRYTRYKTMNKKKLITIVGLFIALFTVSNFTIARQLDEARRAEESMKQLLVPTVEELEASLESNLMLDSMEEEIEDSAIAARLKEYAEKFLGTRYVWGATGPKGFDCSGFTGYVFKSEGIELPRTSRMQYTQGEIVGEKEWQPGDLLFFSSRRSGKGKVGHVAMVVDVEEDGSCTFIHASTKKGVVYQKFPDNAYYSKNYIGAKRII